ncbi:hypothetical protein BOX15_Mlig004516g6, partial [Macrostomum lignano]
SPQLWSAVHGWPADYPMPLITKFEYLMPAATRPSGNLIRRGAKNSRCQTFQRARMQRQRNWLLKHFAQLCSVCRVRWQTPGIGNDSHVIVYDNCMFAPRVWWMFRMFGHEAVSVLDGGLAAWVAEGRRVTSGPLKTVYQSVEFQASEDKKSALYRSFEEFCKALQSASVQVADARSQRFRERSRSPSRPPRWPPARRSQPVLPQPVRLESGRMLTEDQLRKKFLASGLDPSRPLVTTCGSVSRPVTWLWLLTCLATPCGCLRWQLGGFATRGPSDLKAVGSGPERGA